MDRLITTHTCTHHGFQTLSGQKHRVFTFLRRPRIKVGMFVVDLTGSGLSGRQQVTYSSGTKIGYLMNYAGANENVHTAAAVGVQFFHALPDDDATPSEFLSMRRDMDLAVAIGLPLGPDGPDQVPSYATTPNFFPQGSPIVPALESLDAVTKSTSDQLNAFVSGLVNFLYPVSSVLYSADNTNPGVRFTGTTWERIAEGRFIVGQGTSIDSKGVSRGFGAGDTIGEYRHTLTKEEMPAHNHYGFTVATTHSSDDVFRSMPTVKDLVTDNAGLHVIKHENAGHTNAVDASKTPPFEGRGVVDGEVLLKDTGGGESHNNVPPGHALFIWKRTA